MPIRKSRISGGSSPSGTTADRPANPSIGDTFFNGTLGVQEIYTSSGWLPATGANDFNVVLNGEDTSVTLDKEYFSGAYTITSALSDTSFDIYLFDTQGNFAGYTKAPSINATSNFNKIVVLGGQDGDMLSFSYKTTFTTASITDEITVGPVIKSISVADLPNIDDTTVITGINFAEDVQVTFTGTNDIALSAKSIVRSSATSLVVTRPDNLLEDYSPYTVTVTNPGITAPTGTNGHISANAITAGGDPTWITSGGSIGVAGIGQLFSSTLQATDPDAGTISYSLVSGTLPVGLSLNSSTGEISGTPSADSANSFIIQAEDSGGNVTNRSFEIQALYATGGTITESNGYRTHTFTENSLSFTSYLDQPLEVEMLGGGGGGSSGFQAWAFGGGGGSYLLATYSFTPGVNYSVDVGLGGPGQTNCNNAGHAIAGKGGDSSIGTMVASGGSGGTQSSDGPYTVGGGIGIANITTGAASIIKNYTGSNGNGGGDNLSSGGSNGLKASENDSTYGQGAAGTPNYTPGIHADGYGNGGGGGASCQQGHRGGGNGSAGFVKIRYPI